jgi:hypothetical protein
MRSKSVINRDSIFGQKKPLEWGEVIAESYWQVDKNGRVVQSEPATDEILNKLFYPFTTRLDGCAVFLEDVNTGLEVEQTTAAGGVNVERIVFKPRQIVTLAELEAAAAANFKKHYASND